MLDAERNLRIGQRTGAAASPGMQIHTALTLPIDGYRGQAVFMADSHSIKVYDGTAWQTTLTGSGGGGGTVSLQTFVSETQPAADNLGDMWLTPSTGQLRIWDGSAWQDVQDPVADAALTQAGQALNAANAANNQLAILSSEVDGKTVTWYQSTAPTPADGLSVNDLWFKSDTNLLYRYNGSTTSDPWDLIRDGALTQATNDIGNLGAKVDQKVTTYYTTWATRPLGLLPENVGDLLYASDQGNKCYMWRTTGTGYDWVPILVGNGALDEGAVGAGNLTADAINGKTITGATLQTTTVPNQGIKLDATTNQFNAYAPDGTPVFTIDGGTGVTQVVGKFSTGMSFPYLSLQDYSDTVFGYNYGVLAFEMGTALDGEIYCRTENASSTGDPDPLIRQYVEINSGAADGMTDSSLRMTSETSTGGTKTTHTQIDLVADDIAMNSPTVGIYGKLNVWGTSNMTLLQGGVQLGNNKTRDFNGNLTTVNLDSSGYGWISHGLSTTPHVVTVTTYQNSTHVVSVFAKNSTQFQIRMLKTDGTLPTIFTHQINWFAMVRG